MTASQMVRRIGRRRVVTGAPAALARLARAVEAREVALSRSLDAVYVRTGPAHGELTELERDLFWRVLQAPVYEQLFDGEGRPVAMECAAHEGLHVLDPEGVPAVALNFTLCGCGDTNPRLAELPLEHLHAA